MYIFCLFLIEFKIPLVIHGFAKIFFFLLDKRLIGALSFVTSPTSEVKELNFALKLLLQSVLSNSEKRRGVPRNLKRGGGAQFKAMPVNYVYQLHV